MSAPNWYQQQQPEHTRSSSQRTSFEQVNHGTGSTPPQYTGPPPYVVAPYNTGHPHPAGQPHNAGYHHSAGHHQQGGGQAQSTMQPQGFGQQGGYAPRQPFGTQSESRPSNAPQAQWDRQHGHWTTAPQWQNQPEWYASAGPHMRGSPAAPELHKSTEIIQNPFAHSTSNFQAGDVVRGRAHAERHIYTMPHIEYTHKDYRHTRNTATRRIQTHTHSVGVGAES